MRKPPAVEGTVLTKVTDLLLAVIFGSASPATLQRLCTHLANSLGQPTGTTNSGNIKSPAS